MDRIPKPIPPLSEANIADFWSHVSKPNDDNDCWIWQGTRFGKEEDAYGSMSLGKRGTNIQAHRLSYFLHYGEDPYPLCVLHSCDNGRCVNPAHLFKGTKGDNNKDRAAKGRSAHNSFPETRRRGSNHPAHVIDEEIARNAKLLRASGYTSKRTAEILGITRDIVRNMDRGMTWKHVTI